MKILLILSLAACGDPPEKVLAERGRPDPIACVRTAEHQRTCTDGAGVIWTCGIGGGVDATCIATGRVNPEIGVAP